MPFMKVDPDSIKEMLEDLGDDASEELKGQLPSGEFEYSAAEATFKPSKLEAESLIIFEALKAMGVTQFEVSYDGGYDEGFAYPERVFFGKESKTIDQLAKEPAMKKLVEEARKKTKSRQNDWIQGQSDAKVARFLLDELAHELASLLLGEGYGTGEYELYGSFRADFKTGKILDNPKAKKRKGEMGSDD